MTEKEGPTFAAPIRGCPTGRLNAATGASKGGLISDGRICASNKQNAPCRVLSQREMQWKWKACWKPRRDRHGLGQHRRTLPEEAEQGSKGRRTDIADTPGDRALLRVSRGLIGLALDACDKPSGPSSRQQQQQQQHRPTED